MIGLSISRRPISPDKPPTASIYFSHLSQDAKAVACVIFPSQMFFEVEAQNKANAEINNSTIWINIIALSHQGRKTAQTLFEFPIEKLANITVFCFCFFGFYIFFK